MFRAILISCAIIIALCFTKDTFAQNGVHQHNGVWHAHPHNAFHRHIRNPGVAYYPIIQWYPQGIFFNAGPVTVSPDRRYVRMGINFGFSSITGFHTFNYSTGQTRWYPSKNRRNR